MSSNTFFSVQEWGLPENDENIQELLEIFNFDKFINVPNLGNLYLHFFEKVVEESDNQKKEYSARIFLHYLDIIQKRANAFLHYLLDKKITKPQKSVGQKKTNLGEIAIRVILGISYKKFNFGNLKLTKKTDFVKFLKEIEKGNIKLE